MKQDNSIFIDEGIWDNADQVTVETKDTQFNVYTWNDKNLGKIIDNKLYSPLSIDKSTRYKIDFFIDKIIGNI